MIDISSARETYRSFQIAQMFLVNTRKIPAYGLNTITDMVHQGTGLYPAFMAILWDSGVFAAKRAISIDNRWE